LFDEVANFEEQDERYYRGNTSYQALTFRNGKMRVIDDKGKYLTAETEMQAHKGYKSFDELKQALIKALDSDGDELLKDFANKIAPSEHLLFYLNKNIFNDNKLESIYIPNIKERYLNVLLLFKYRYWKDSSSFRYDRTSLTDVSDFNHYYYGYLTNYRHTDHAFGNVKYLEKILRNAVKINGFWISTYFMKHYF